MNYETLGKTYYDSTGQWGFSDLLSKLTAFNFLYWYGRTNVESVMGAKSVGFAPSNRFELLQVVDHTLFDNKRGFEGYKVNFIPMARYLYYGESIYANTNILAETSLINYLKLAECTGLSFEEFCYPTVRDIWQDSSSHISSVGIPLTYEGYKPFDINENPEKFMATNDTAAYLYLVNYCKSVITTYFSEKAVLLGSIGKWEDYDTERKNLNSYINQHDPASKTNSFMAVIDAPLFVTIRQTASWIYNKPQPTITQTPYGPENTYPCYLPVVMGVSIAKALKEYCVAEYKRLLSPIIDNVCARFFTLKTPGQMIQYQHENEDPLKNPFLIFDPDKSTPTKSVYRNVAKNYGISMMGPVIIPVEPPALPPAYLHVQEVKDILTQKIILPSGLIVSSFDINSSKEEGGGLLPWLLAGAAAALAIKAST